MEESYPKQEENTVGKGEIARYEQFLLFPQCFQKACFPGASKGVIGWEWVNRLPHGKILDLSKLKAIADDYFSVAQVVQFFSDRVENVVGKGEHAGYQHVLLFQQCFQRNYFSGPLKAGIVW